VRAANPTEIFVEATITHGTLKTRALRASLRATGKS
jgi:hypothetical protein